MNSPISTPSFHASMLHAWSAFSDEFIAVWNEECSSIQFCNEAYTQFFGYGTKQDFINQYTFFGCRKHPLGEEIQTLVLDTLKKAGSWTEEVMMVKKNGSSFLCRLDITGFEFEEKLFYLQRIINIDAQRVFSENLFKEAKKCGFGDVQISKILQGDCTDEQVYEKRKALGITRVYKMVDTCAAEFEAKTPYFYSTFEG